MNLENETDFIEPDSNFIYFLVLIPQCAVVFGETV